MSIHFPGGVLSLEGEWHLPEGKGPFPAVVVCHPHPLYGGDMSSNVVVAVCQALAASSIAAFRFNFRGVGGSGGTFDKGIGEQDDVKAALTFVAAARNIDPARVGLAGYSFGARVAFLAALTDERVKLLALVSPPLAESDWPQLKGYIRPKFIISGDADFVLPPERLKLVRNTFNDTEYAIIPAADHYWGGFESELGQKVARFFVAGFRQL
ncbi:MAG: alpha/beta fold hydrolase [Chloroflexota bacterium]|nr:alpha/beta fold hydrolase [Chloroflexota bacterium]